MGPRPIWIFVSFNWLYYFPQLKITFKLFSCYKKDNKWVCVNLFIYTSKMVITFKSRAFSLYTLQRPSPSSLSNCHMSCVKLSELRCLLLFFICLFVCVFVWPSVRLSVCKFFCSSETKDMI